jgi:hypothetical protein
VALSSSEAEYMAASLVDEGLTTGQACSFQGQVGCGEEHFPR